MPIGSFTICDLVDIDDLKPLFDGFSETTGFTAGLVEQTSNNVLIFSGWRNLCRNFHRAHPESALACQSSNRALSSNLQTAGEVRIRQCRHGLMDGCTPIIVEGRHLANIFSGQVFFTPPDLKYFRRQAELYNYDTEAYLQALAEIPIISEEQLSAALHFLALQATTVSKIGLANLHSQAQQRKIENQKALLSCLINSIPDLIFYKDREGAYLGCNQAFADFAGKSEEEIVGQSDFGLFDGETASFFRKQDRTMLASGQAQRNQEWGIYPDGRKVRLEAVKAPYIGPTGQMLGLVGVSRDITRLKQVEDQLAEERELLLVTLRSIGEGVIATDNNGSVVLINEVAEQLTGWSQKEATGRTVAEVFRILNEQTGQPCATSAQRVLESGAMASPASDRVLMSRDGTRRQVSSSTSPIRTTAGNIIGTVLIFQDISEQRHTEQALHRVDKLESLGVLAGGVAHDFNNILTAIVGNISLASKMIDPEHQIQNLLATAEKASWRAKDLTQQLLTFAQGGQPIKETISVASIIQDSSQFVLYGSPVACNFHTVEDLWLVNIDTGQMSQVIQNLVLNARHAMPGGGCIDIYCDNLPAEEAGSYLQHPGKPHIRITVRDNGVGIPEKHLASIFDPYFSTKQEGSGLGLAIVHSIINKHDGFIEVQSREGAGTTFTIYLPVAVQSSMQVEPQKTRMEQGNGTVMVMDDEECLRELAQQVLTHLGYQSITAKDGAEAVERYRELHQGGKTLDAVIMDLTIPGGMGGKDAVQAILEIDPQAKAIASSGYSSDPVMCNFREYGFSGAISKPFRMETLAQLLAEVIAEH
jgi:PAS domain S-box-containing protein